MEKSSGFSRREALKIAVLGALGLAAGMETTSCAPDESCPTQANPADGITQETSAMCRCIQDNPDGLNELEVTNGVYRLDANGLRVSFSIPDLAKCRKPVKVQVMGAVRLTNGETDPNYEFPGERLVSDGDTEVTITVPMPDEVASVFSCWLRGTSEQTGESYDSPELSKE